jgi:hypothetical protein
MRLCTPCLAALAAALLPAPSFGAIDATGAAQTPVFGVANLDLGPDGSWDKALGATLATAAPGADFGFANASPSGFWMRERWIGGPNSSVAIDTSLPMADTGRATFPITINKEVTNDAGFAADTFVITLTEQAGSAISGVAVAPNALLADASIANPAPGVTEITFSQGAGAVFAPGDTTNFVFSFEVTGDIDFRITQALIPTPGAGAIVGLAALAAVRRRR